MVLYIEQLIGERTMDKHRCTGVPDPRNTFQNNKIMILLARVMEMIVRNLI